MINFLNNFNFGAIAQNAPTKNPCPDQIVGILDQGNFISQANRTNVDYVMYGNYPMVSNKLSNPIVIVLESPHINEFDPITGAAIGPAAGKTGVNFKKYFQQLITSSAIYQHVKNKVCHIILLNAVQYQCSLGKNLRTRGNKKNKRC